MSYDAAHAEVNGAGDARPTAMDIIKDEDLVDKLQGKVFLITGGNSGIGVETARAIYATGAHVFITSRCVSHRLHRTMNANVLKMNPGLYCSATCRDLKKGEEVAQEIAASNPSSKGKIDVLKLEFGRPAVCQAVCCRLPEQEQAAERSHYQCWHHGMSRREDQGRL